jgi:hypothetical protein
MNHQFFGPYRGIVVDNLDPLDSMRLRVQVPTVFGEAQTCWALPCVPPGFTLLPEVGAMVWIEFEAGDISHPIWIGTLGTRGVSADRMK